MVRYIEGFEYKDFVISNATVLKQLWKSYVFDYSRSYTQKTQIFYKTEKIFDR